MTPEEQENKDFELVLERYFEKKERVEISEGNKE